MSEALARLLCRRLQDAGHQAYVAGGWVRDRLLERSSGDLDIATSARPDQVTAVFDRVHPTGLKHGTVTVMVEDTPVEVTTYRAESPYSDGRRPDEVTFLDHIEDDLKRRQEEEEHRKRMEEHARIEKIRRDEYARRLEEIAR